MTNEIKDAIQRTWDTRGSTEIDTGTDELGLVSWHDGRLLVELGPNEHEMDAIGEYDSVDAAYDAVVAELDAVVA